MADPDLSEAPLPSSFDQDADFHNEKRLHKFTRRLKEEPLIPVAIPGCALTVWALQNAVRSSRSGDSSRTNQYFRYRLYAQSFTIVAMLGGSFYYNADRLKRGEYVKLKKEQDKQAKKDAWIRELEARDAEDHLWREKVKDIQNAQREEAERTRLARQKEKDEGQDSDSRGVLEAVRQKSDEAKAKETRMQKVEEGFERRPKVEGKLESPPPPGGGPERPKAKPKSVFGESEEGGIMGFGTLKALWKYLSSDPDGSEDEK
ncbi:uncharacterized protein KY384_001802 [Bacidia gigantensis]|uniref:uncharacterized protein n=1 Tax=Bacidia gigantensis TaxID=2732470 RepID=UPI001D04E2A2|nr:uncharacterized protein KY384_001802 [Bacidia gigantensis]KAG8533019.1 hypothetical protein KY384_001802 [Bacidia gigantensis]